MHTSQIIGLLGFVGVITGTIFTAAWIVDLSSDKGLVRKIVSFTAGIPLIAVSFVPLVTGVSMVNHDIATKLQACYDVHADAIRGDLSSMSPTYSWYFYEKVSDILHSIEDEDTFGYQTTCEDINALAQAIHAQAVLSHDGGADKVSLQEACLAEATPGIRKSILGIANVDDATSYLALLDRLQSASTNEGAKDFCGNVSALAVAADAASRK